MDDAESFPGTATNFPLTTFAFPPLVRDVVTNRSREAVSNPALVPNPMLNP